MPTRQTNKILVGVTIAIVSCVGYSNTLLRCPSVKNINASYTSEVPALKAHWENTMRNLKLIKSFKAVTLRYPSYSDKKSENNFVQCAYKLANNRTLYLRLPRTYKVVGIKDSKCWAHIKKVNIYKCTNEIKNCVFFVK